MASYDTIDNFTLHNTLGNGQYGKVKLATTQNGEKCAVKLIRLDKCAQPTQQVIDIASREMEAMKKLQNEHTVKLFGGSLNATWNKKNGKKIPCAYMALELMKGGELFDLLSETGAFPEPIARYYFRQLLKGLHKIHCAGMAHRDLKPANLLLDDDYNLKITDFGFVAPLTGRHETGVMQSNLGTPDYKAPELYRNEEYSGQAADLFSCAVILFNFSTGLPPYVSDSTKNDQLYQFFYNHKEDKYWRYFQKNLPQLNFSQDFMDLMTGLLQNDPLHRPTMADVVSHPWMQGEIASYAEIKAEMEMRTNQLKEAKRKEAEIKVAEKRARQVKSNKARRGLGDKQDEETQIKRALDQYHDLMKRKTQFFTKSDANTVFASLTDLLVDLEVKDMKVSDKKYKIEYIGTQTLPSIQIDVDDEEESKAQEQNIQFKVCVKLFKFDDDHICVDFQRQEGSNNHFSKHFDSVQDQLDDVEEVVF